MGLSLASHPCVKPSLQGDQTPVWSSPYLSDMDHQVAMTVSLPFSRGIVLAYLKLPKLHALFAQFYREKQPTEMVFITDADGVLLAHPDTDLVTQRTNVGNLAIVRLGKNQGRGSLLFDMDGVRQLGSVIRIPRTGWLVVVAQPVSEAHAVAHRVRWIVILGVVAAMMGALVISLASSRRLLRPILGLAAYTQKIARGDYSRFPPGETKYAEIMALSAAFSAMVRAVKEREASLLASEARYSGLLERLNEAVYRLSVPDGRCDYISPASLAVFGYSPEQFKNHPFLLREIMHPQSTDWFEAQWNKLENGEVDASFEYRILDADNNERWIYQTNAAVRDEQGRITALECCCNNITARRRAEQELEKYHAHLEDLVRHRTQALRTAQQELIKKEKLAVLGRLTATVSHELRNPLGVIRSSSYYIGRVLGDADLKVRKHIDRIDEQIKICDVIVADLLEYTRGRTSEAMPGDLNRFVSETLETIAVPPDIHLEMVLEPNLPATAFDAEKFRSVLNNLVNNALQAVAERIRGDDGQPVGGPDITVKTASDSEFVCLVIEDKGIGMDAQVLEHVFEPLYTTRARGTGLGLAIVHKIVGEHKGRIDLQSTPGSGTCATIRLPRLDKDSTGL